MKRIVLSLLLSLASAQAASHYIRAGASGNGSSWANAWPNFGAATWTRGDTYYVAGGTYSSFALSEGASGTSVITIKAATAAVNGSDPGWSGSYASQVLVTGGSGKEINISSPYWVIDGSYRGTDWRSGYGMKVYNNVDPNQGYCVGLDSGASHVILTNLDLQGTSGMSANPGEGDYCVYHISSAAAITDLTISHCYLHESGNTQIQVNTGVTSDRFLCEYNYIYKNHAANNDTHDEAFSLTWQNATIKFNIMQDIISSGFICWAAGPDPQFTRWDIYGNVFCWSTAYQNNSGAYVGGSGVVGLFGTSPRYGSIYFYNNTIYGIKTLTGVDNVFYSGVDVTTSPHAIENNIWYDCQQVGFFGGNESGASPVGYNSYYGPNSYNDNDTGAHTTHTASLPSIFVDPSSFNFRLSSATTAGTALGSPLNVDPDGTVRGADGAWDRGAYEYPPGSGGTSSNPPSILTQPQTVTCLTNSIVTFSVLADGTAPLEYQWKRFDLALAGATQSSYQPVTALTNDSSWYVCAITNAYGATNSSAAYLYVTNGVEDLVPPVVSVTRPTNTSILSGESVLTASASDNVGLSSVQFMLDGGLIGSPIVSPPYTYAWHSISTGDGPHSVQAKAVDLSANAATSSVVNVTVRNIVTNGLAGYWNFEEGSGASAADSSASDNPMTLNGATWVQGTAGSYAMSLDGSSYASAPDAASQRMSGSMTVALWVKHSALPAAGSWQYYLEKGQDTSENYGFGAFNNAGVTRLFFEWANAASITNQAVGPALATNAWTHVAVVFNSTNHTTVFYNSGSPVATNAASVLSATTDPLMLGEQNIGGYEFRLNGLLDDVRIYNRTLSDSEVLSLFSINAGATNPPSAPSKMSIRVGGSMSFGGRVQL